MKKLKEQPGKMKILIGTGIVVAVLVVIYIAVGLYFSSHFFPNTTVNGMDCSGMTAKDVDNEIRKDVSGYSLELTERDGSTETIKGSDIGLEADLNGETEQLLKKQPNFAWIAHIKGPNKLNAETGIVYDNDQLTACLNALNCTDQEKMVKSEDAQIVYTDEGTFEIQPAVFGTQLNQDTFNEKIKESLGALNEKLNLEDSGCYVDPVYTEDSQEVKSACSQMNSLLKSEIVYDMGDGGTVAVSKKEMAGWLMTGDKMNVTFNEDAIEDFVSDLAAEYNTVDKGHTLKTTWGPTVTVPSGNYGWKINKSEEIEKLKEDVMARKKVTREPVYSRTANSHGANDYGNTYVEINLTAQHLYFYKNGNLVVDSDFVSGNVSKDYTTPTGAYAVTYTERDAVLKGPGYASPVDFWMPFNGGVGMHDATWRSKFGGTIYKTNGSHGCINLPYSAAQKIFENLKKGDPVLVYNLPGTEQGQKTSSADTSSADTQSSEDQTQNNE